MQSMLRVYPFLIIFSHSPVSQNLLLPLVCHNLFLRYLQPNMHRCFQNTLQNFSVLFFYHFISEIDTWFNILRDLYLFSICTKAKIQMSGRTKIMLTLFSLCYIALASTCQQENFTFFQDKNNMPRFLLVPFILSYQKS